MPSTSENKDIRNSAKEIFTKSFCTFVQLTLKKIILLMKKTYVSPFAEEVNIETTQMLAASIGINDDKEVDTTTPGDQLSDDRRGEWGDLWK